MEGTKNLRLAREDIHIPLTTWVSLQIKAYEACTRRYKNPTRMEIAQTFKGTFATALGKENIDPKQI